MESTTLRKTSTPSAPSRPSRRRPDAVRRAAPLALLAIACCLFHEGAGAQERRTMIGVTAGRWLVDASVTDVAVGVHVTSVKPGGLGYEASVTTLPALLAYRAIVLVPELGLTWVVGGDGVQLRPRIGPSAVGVIAVGPGGGGAGLMVGGHAGAALLVPLGSETSLRIQGAARRFLGGGPAMSLGVGVMWGRR